MTTTFTIDWALAGQYTVCAIVLLVLIGAVRMGVTRSRE
jgi:hypothetical protein